MGLEKLLLVPAMMISLQSNAGIADTLIRKDPIPVHSESSSVLTGSGKTSTHAQRFLCNDILFGPSMISPYDSQTNAIIDEFYSGKSSLVETIGKLSGNKDYIVLREQIQSMEMSTSASRLLSENYYDSEYGIKMLQIGVLGEAYNSCRYLFSLPQKITCEKKDGFPITPEFEQTFEELKKSISYGPVLEASKKLMEILSSAEPYEEIRKKVFDEEFVSMDNLARYTGYARDGLFAIQAIELLDFVKDRENVETEISYRVLGVIYQYKILSVMNYLKNKEIRDLFRLPEPEPERNPELERYTV